MAPSGAKADGATYSFGNTTDQQKPSEYALDCAMRKRQKPSILFGIRTLRGAYSCVHIFRQGEERVQVARPSRGEACDGAARRLR